MPHKEINDMTWECFKVDLSDNIAHVILNRPDKRNSMNHAFWRELPEIIEDIDNNARARVIVISSTGPHFSAGLDLSMFQGNSEESSSEKPNKNQRAVASYNHILHMQKSFNCLEACRLPVLVAIQGGAFGGGVDLATACDIRVAVYGSKRMINYARDHTTADALDYISIWNTSMMNSEEILEAMSAKAEQREGEFADLPSKRG